MNWRDLIIGGLIGLTFIVGMGAVVLQLGWRECPHYNATRW